MFIDHSTAREENHNLLHVVGAITDEVYSFMGPASRAFAKVGHTQTIVVVGDSMHGCNVAKFADSVVLHRVTQHKNPFKQWLAVTMACRHEMNKATFSAIHLHGVLPCLAGFFALRLTRTKTLVVMSPHGSRFLKTPSILRKAVVACLRLMFHGARSHAIVSLEHESDGLRRWVEPKVVNHPIDPAFSKVERRESDTPLILGGGADLGLKSLENFAQLAVLMSGRDLGIRFHWNGTVPKGWNVKLTAANVSILEATEEEARAEALAGGWVYVASGTARGFPLLPLQAMTVGLPCVAIDCEQHRAIIENDVTGFLCASEKEMMVKVAALMDDPLLRARIGNAGKAMALARFEQNGFEQKLLSVYPARMGN